MLCGCCGRKMLEGYIPTPGIEWVPKNMNSKLIYNGAKENGFRIGRMHIFSMKKQIAWYCHYCELIVIDCKVEK